ncbi:MAG: PQQ-like beta-propeller repeat protein [Pontiellaceae bacterium]|jgi:outer membrane protein assembly factor BamB|nr:PQQ-like beta-propeller repeat protein [Pontiellaceae bacterium]
MKPGTVRLIVAVSVFALCGGVAVSLLFHWVAADPAYGLTRSLPGADDGPSTSERAETGEVPVNLTGTLETFDGTPSDLPGSWPRFRGADFDNICKADVKLANRWPETGPEILWSVALGEGHAAPAVLNGCAYLFDYDEATRSDALRCFSLADGREIWRRSYPLSAKRNHGLSRTIPAVTEDCIVTIGPRCHVSCVETKTGAFRWGIDLQKEYATSEPLWFTGQCPLIDNGLAILAPGGPEALMMAVDCKTGAAVWKTPNPAGWKMSHSSIMPLTLHGEKMYVYAAVGGMAGISTNGVLLWKIPWKASVIAPSPVPISGNRIFITAGYGAGSLMVQIDKTSDGYAARELAQNGPQDWLACEQQTPILFDGLLYGIMPKDGGALKQQFVCYNPDGKEPVWSSGKTARFGLGPFFLADGKFFILDDDGTLTMISASRSGYAPLAQHKVLDGYDAWGPIALAGTRMLLRDSTQMVCIEVGEKK